MNLINYTKNKASFQLIEQHLLECNQYFIPPLNQRVIIKEYASKLYTSAENFEAWDSAQLIGLVSAYANDSFNKICYISSVSVSPNYRGRGIAKELIKLCISHISKIRFESIELEVHKLNIEAKNLYEQFNFKVIEKNNETLKMKLIMINKTDRNYNEELKDSFDHKYAYNFDFDVMHPFMIKSFIPFFQHGNVLELGSFKGDFTKRLFPYFNDITCVEASNEAIAVAKKEFDDKVNFVNALFEEVSLPRKYDNVILTHVLEHLDDPCFVLQRINNEWLNDNGRFFLVCPNANAPSRQIAVKMGLISHNSAITRAEAEHGHRITYTLDTLERDAKKAGLKVIYRTGIFFKALANFQWDRLLNTDIISKQYLEGCYELGHQYPDLCSSIMLVCEKG